jgi:putative acetyltransferase
MKTLKFRTLTEADNEVMAKIIRSSLEEKGVDRPGTVYTDPTTDNLSSLFQSPGSVYFVAELNDEVIGGCGIYPTKGLSLGYVELVKLYLKASAKGRGLGAKLMTRAIEWAQSNGATHIYLETLNELSSAVQLYEKLGFKYLDEPLGDSGHHACDIWMVKELSS